MGPRGCPGWMRVGAGALAMACVLAGLAASPASASAVCRGWTGAPPAGGGALISGMAVVSACDLWATDDTGTFEHWTGGADWVTVPGDPSAGGQVFFSGVAATSATSIWAAGGSEDSSGARHELIERWDGSRWTRVSTPDLGPGSQGQFFSVSAVSASSAWAAGRYFDSSDNRHELIERWDGSRWTRVSTPDLGPGNEGEFFSVSALSAGNAWAVGIYVDSGNVVHPLAEHWDGSSWTVVPVPDLDFSGARGELFSVAAVSASSAWAVGSARDAGAAIEHWDGRSWSRMTVPAPRASWLPSVTALSASNVWAVGHYADSSGQIHPLAEHWDGTGWTFAPVPDLNGGGQASLNAVAAAPDGSVWVGGAAVVSGSRGSSVAAPLTGSSPAEMAVNMTGRNLREAGLVNGPAGNLSVAAGTSPSVAMTPAGDIETAWTAANDHLWTVDGAGRRTDTMHLAAPGTGPAITALSGGGYEVAYVNAADGDLWLMSPAGNFSMAAGGVAVAAGTSPAIAAAPGGEFATAVHAAQTDHLVVVTSDGVRRDTGLALAAGTSPAITAVPGGFEVAVHAAGSDQLVTVGPDGSSRNTGLLLAAGTSPAIAADPGGGWQAAGHAAGTDHLVASAGGINSDDPVVLAAGTSPALTAVPGGGYELAYTTRGGDLATVLTDGGGPAMDTGIGVSAATSPAIAAYVPPLSMVTVPDVTSDTQDEARQAITGAGLTLGPTTFDTTCKDAANRVVGQTPGGGARVPFGTPVNLTVSTGTDIHGKPCTLG